MEVSFELSLPRQEASVPVVRHLAREVLVNLGVDQECVDDVELALTEACSNVLKHAARQQDDYEVNISIDTVNGFFKICDTGGEFDVATIPPDPAATEAERGRGIALMNAVVEDLDIQSTPDTGTVVRFAKKLEFSSDSVVRQLTPTN
jgi:serine/threonine-protein kinase RsbW